MVSLPAFLSSSYVWPSSVNSPPAMRPPTRPSVLPICGLVPFCDACVCVWKRGMASVRW